jgi:hypothetical protein
MAEATELQDLRVSAFWELRFAKRAAGSLRQVLPLNLFLLRVSVPLW